ncbi:MAG: hypothetical protein IJ128_06245 [Firmicutes bacterium]|nr:hypothetical protein [Bacillota bacterium]
MKKNLLRKIGVIAACAAVSMTMGTASFAATAENGVATTNDTTLDITKEILVYNDEDTTVYGPGITYEYSVAPDAGGKKISDKDGNAITASAGVAGGVTLTDSTAEFEKNANVEAKSAGTSISDTITASIDLSKFSKAGVYCYKITEARPDTLETAGLTRPAEYDVDRYLDVYIGNTANGLGVTGYVVFIGGDSIKGKTTGFAESYDPEGDTDGTGMADKYYTYNYAVNKVVEGTLADKTNQFPFTFETAGAVTGQKFSVTIDGNTNTAEIGTDVTAALADGGKIVIKGLPANTTFNVTEGNNTPDTYQVAVKDDTAGEVVAQIAVDPSKSQAMFDEAGAITNYAQETALAPTAAYTAATFTNTLNDVSPTNVVTRYAPFLFILAAAIVLLVVMRRRKHSDSEDAE